MATAWVHIGVGEAGAIGAPPEFDAMSRTHLKAILPQIHQLFASGTDIGMSDRALLRRYCTSSDENAFTSLVARHGAMVWSVCQGVFRDENRAEDAFQAVWLVLVRRAQSIRVEDSLGGWLHGVACRVAIRARSEHARRRLRERTGMDIDGAHASRAGTPDSRLGALHEEIARLPDAMRQSLVLCFLEGKTQVEAAQEIGCGEATVRRRLASARERLRTRLERHGIDAAAPVSLADVPPRLVELATRAAAGPTSALAANVLREMSRALLLKLLACLAFIGVAASGIAWVTAARTAPAPSVPAKTLTVVPPVVARPAVVDEPDPFEHPEWGTVEVPGRVVGPDGTPIAGATIFLRKYGVRVPGRKTTTDAEGRFKFTAFRRQGPRLSAVTPNPVVKTTTLPGGITITVTETNNYLGAPHSDESEINGIKPWIVATAPGFGVGTLAPGDDVTIKLVPDEPITGRVTDEAGKPLAGARVRVRDVHWPRRPDDPIVRMEDRRGRDPAPPIPSGEGLEPWLSAMRRAANMQDYYVAREYLIGLIDLASLGDKPAVHAPLISPVMTDADGRFTLKGVGRDRVAQLYIDGVSGKASTLILVANRSIEQPILIGSETFKGKSALTVTNAEVVVFGNKFEIPLVPGRTIEGVVSDRASGLPLEGWRVIGPTVTPLEYPGFDRFFATTDNDGHYRIDGFPIMRARFKVEAASRKPGGRITMIASEEPAYFGRTMTINVKPGDGPQRVDLPLSRGIWITGKVVDDATGEGLNGETIEYHAFKTNPFLKRDLQAGIKPGFDDNMRTNADGTFKLRAYPGRGIVTAGGGGDYLYGIGADKITGLKPDEIYETLYGLVGFSPYIRNTTIEVNVPDDARTFSCELRLKKGKSRMLRIVGPDGKPEADLEASGLEESDRKPDFKG